MKTYREKNWNDYTAFRKHICTCVQIALVAQEPVLYYGSIRDNIAYGVPGATDADVRDAASTANAAAFIDALKDGYETACGERGVQLSGSSFHRDLSKPSAAAVAAAPEP